MPVRSSSCWSAGAIVALAGSGVALGAGPFGPLLNLSSLNGANGFVINGIDANDISGVSVSSAGDVNGDGVDDLLIGATGGDPNGQSLAGESYVVFGKKTPFAASFNLSTLNGTNGFVLNGIDAGDFCGISVSSAGDVNGDGVDDLIIGAHGGDPNGQSFAGESYVVFGKITSVAGPFAASINLSTLNGANGFVVNGIDADDRSGGAVAGAGDINGDGIGDLIIGAKLGDPNGLGAAGEASIVFGKLTPFAASLNLSTLNGTTGFVVNGIAINDQCGNSVAAAGDVNGDGIDDFIIGAEYADPNGVFAGGEAYVVFGRSTPFAASMNLSTLNGTNGFRMFNPTELDLAGHSVRAAGDVNGDGVGDLIVGASFADPGGRSYAGQSHIVFGRHHATGGSFPASIDLSALNGTDGFTVNGIDPNDASGHSVSSAGDVNGDGFDDFFIGARSASPFGLVLAGESYIVFGGPSVGATGSMELSALNGTNGFVLAGIDPIDESGVSVASAGDVNGDGIDDLIIGAQGGDPNGQSYAGESYVVFGRLGQVWTSLSGGSWSTGSRWLSGIAPVAGTVVIDPQFGVTVSGPTGAVTLKKLTLGADFGVTTLSLAGASLMQIEDAFSIGASAALAGGGVLAVDDAITCAGLIAPDSLTVIATLGLSNTGLIDVAPVTPNAAAKIDLYGSVVNASAGDILLRSGAVEFGAWNGLANSGHLDIVDADATVFGDVTNTGAPVAGAISIIAESFALFTDDVNNQSTITVDADSSLAILGVLSGNGVSGPGGAGTAGPVFVGGGVSPGASPGIARFDGDLTLGGGAISTIEISGTVPGTGHDQVVVAGVLGAAGTLRVTTPGGFVPLSGHAYKVLDFGSVIGSFSQVQLSSSLVSASADISTLLIDGTIRIPAPTCAGDINGDGDTNAADFTILAGNFGGSVPPNTGGDLNGDGLVNAADFVILAGDFGCGS